MHTLSTLFWNVWFDTQDGRFGDGTATLARLEQLIDEYNPDVIGLNEVLTARGKADSKVTDLLQRKGYHTHFSPFYEHSDRSVTGNVFASKQKPLSVTHHHLEKQLGTEVPKHHLYLQSHLIEAQLRVGSNAVTVFVTHLCSLWPHEWATHRRHRAAFEKLTHAAAGPNVIVGGDFNETKFMLPWLKPSNFYRLTGTVLNPTWRWRGKKRMLLHGNLDRILFTKDSNLRLKSFKILDRKPSDHAPLLAYFEVK